MAWEFLSNLLTFAGAGAFLAKEGGSALKERVNFEVSEQYREKFFEEWVDKDLEEKLRKDLETPSKYNEIWERIEAYKRDRGEIYLMRKDFGEKEGLRYYWDSVGEVRLPIRDPRGRVPNSYDRQIYATNYSHTMSMLMNTYGKLTEGDAWYIFDLCYKSIKKYGKTEIMERTFSLAHFRKTRKHGIDREEFMDTWAISPENDRRVMGYIEDPTHYEEAWDRIEKYKNDGGELYLRLKAFEEKRPQENRNYTGMALICFLCAKYRWGEVGLRRPSIDEVPDPPYPGSIYDGGKSVTETLLVNTYGKLSSLQADGIYLDCLRYGIEF